MNLKSLAKDTALFLALLTFGMETTLFRFANKPGTDDRMVYSNALRMVGCVGLGFLALVFLLLHPIAGSFPAGQVIPGRPVIPGLTGNLFFPEIAYLWKHESLASLLSARPGAARRLRPLAAAAHRCRAR